MLFSRRSDLPLPLQHARNNNVYFSQRSDSSTIVESSKHESLVSEALVSGRIWPNLAESSARLWLAVALLNSASTANVKIEGGSTEQGMLVFQCRSFSGISESLVITVANMPKPQ